MGADSELDRLRGGDADAFDALLAQYQNRLFRYLLRLAGDRSLAEDLFQQTWLRVMSRLDLYDQGRPFEPWLFGVARNLAIDHLRRHSPESLDEPSPSGEPWVARLRAEEPGHLDRLLERERSRLLEERVAELPLVYREALALRFEEEMTFEEMAAALSAPVSTVKSRVQRALSTLRRRMSPGRERQR